MKNLVKLFILIIFISSCSFNPNSSLWTKRTEVKKDNILSSRQIVKKETILEQISLDLSNNYYNFIDNILTSDMNMVQYGINLKKLFHKTFNDINIDLVIIENQIGPLALRMKTLQGMIMQHFIENNITNIVPVNSINKLKEFLGNTKTTYDERKKQSIIITRDLIKNTKWVEHFEKHKKKDDLADCFLQGLWYIKHKI